LAINDVLPATESDRIAISLIRWAGRSASSQGRLRQGAAAGSTGWRGSRIVVL